MSQTHEFLASGRFQSGAPPSPPISVTLCQSRICVVKVDLVAELQLTYSRFCLLTRSPQGEPCWRAILLRRMPLGSANVEVAPSRIAGSRKVACRFVGLNYGEANCTNPSHFLFPVGCLRGVVPERTCRLGSGVTV